MTLLYLTLLSVMSFYAFFFFFLMHEQNLTILQAFLCVFGFTSVAGPRGRHLLLLEGIASAAGGNRHLALDALVLG